MWICYKQYFKDVHLSSFIDTMIFCPMQFGQLQFCLIKFDNYAGLPGHLTKLNLTKPNQTKPNQTKPNLT